MPPSDFWFKKLGKMINDPYYNLNVRWSSRLLDWGFIELKREYTSHMGIHFHCSYYHVTESGKKAYEEWKNK